MRPDLKLRPIRSFVLRAGRLTKAQLHAMEHYLPLYGLDSSKRFDAAEHFVNPASPIFEIGFGNGFSLLEMAKAMPQYNFIGVEVHAPGVGAILQGIHEAQLTNLKIYFADAELVMSSALAEGSLASCHLFFPDPWPKKKHHKRRILRPEFLNQLHPLLEEGGCFHMATDWQPYAESALDVLQARSDFVNCSLDKTYCKKPDYRPFTKFERRGQRLGHGVWDLLFTKK